MAGNFATPVSSPLPAFLASPAPTMGAKRAKKEIVAIRREAKAAAASAAAPATTVRTIGGYTTAYSMSSSLQQLLGRLGSFLAHLLPQTPAKPPKTPPHAPGGDTDFVISSFNVLRTSAGNTKHFASSKARMQWVTQILDAHQVGVVGFQEMDASQLAEFKRLAGRKYGTFAGASGQRGYHDTTLAWRKDTWSLVKADTLTVPSYEGRPSKVPFVRLRNKQTGQEAYFVDVHNPANTRRHHHQEAYRDAAAKKEADLVKRLMAESGLPVFMVGDFNAVEPARKIVTQGAPVVAANAQTHNRAGIDWIFGSKGVKFSRFSRTREGLIQKATDHPALFSQVHIDGR